MNSVPLAIALNIGLIIFVAWVIVWLVTKNPPESGGTCHA